MSSNLANPQVITCKAIVCWDNEEPLRLEEIQVDPPKSSEIRVKMLYASLCHTDILCTRGFPTPLFPRVLGHEGVGEVESIGEGVEDFKIGDLVIPVFLGECQECENCESGKTNLCLKYGVDFSGLMPDGTSRLSAKGKKLYHLLSCATWAEYMVTDVNYVVKIDPTMHLPYASLLSCGYTTGFGSAWMAAKVEKGSSVAIFGLGAVGLGAVEAARMQGAAKIIGIDINEKKKDTAEILGMTHFINPKESGKKNTEAVKDLTGGMGVDYCFECTGVPSLINEAIQSTKPGRGQTIVVGAGNDPTVAIDFLPLLCGGNLKGCVFGQIKVKSQLPIIMDMCKNKVKPFMPTLAMKSYLLQSMTVSIEHNL
ncbi:hypothetical protein Tsubulata_038263 [Turnera subulata]|uniref:Enoyl reductase (ER) domain-containing protein n=1 Tax=Turnera subulata TaxID=218843 RepID=A0A9Q0FUH5_9ROSI|nr:hypothetical protein Tsubulata_038263 [Turnera subulata]